MQTTMVNTPKRNILPLPADKFGKPTKPSTEWRLQVNETKSGLEAERVQALGELCSLWPKKKHAAKKWRKMHFFSNEEKEKLIKHYIERETAEARKRVEHTEAAVQQVQDAIRKAENAGLIHSDPK